MKNEITAEQILNDPKYREMSNHELIQVLYDDAFSEEEFDVLISTRDRWLNYPDTKFLKLHIWLINEYYPNNPIKPTIEQMSNMEFWDSHELEAISTSAGSLTIGKIYSVCHSSCGYIGLINDRCTYNTFQCNVVLTYFKVVKKQPTETKGQFKKQTNLAIAQLEAKIANVDSQIDNIMKSLEALKAEKESKPKVDTRGLLGVDYLTPQWMKDVVAGMMEEQSKPKSDNLVAFEENTEIFDEEGNRVAFSCWPDGEIGGKETMLWVDFGYKFEVLPKYDSEGKDAICIKKIN